MDRLFSTMPFALQPLFVLSGFAAGAAISGLLAPDLSGLALLLILAATLTVSGFLPWVA
jgi:uncharacterized membrane protein YoaK (UPF0700 family)